MYLELKVCYFVVKVIIFSGTNDLDSRRGVVLCFGSFLGLCIIAGDSEYISGIFTFGGFIIFITLLTICESIELILLNTVVAGRMGIFPDISSDSPGLNRYICGLGLKKLLIFLLILLSNPFLFFIIIPHIFLLNLF